MKKFLGQYNVSEKYRFQWIAPERTGSRKVSSILSFFGFTNGDSPIFAANQHNYTHEVLFSENYKDYGLICSARNPYGKTLAIFKNLYTQKARNGTKEDFKKYVFEDLKLGQTINMVQKPLIDKNIDYILKLENLSDDLKKIPFVLQKFTPLQVENLCEHGKPIFNWEEYYDQETKDEVYSYTKHLFEIWGYER